MFTTKISKSLQNTEKLTRRQLKVRLGIKVSKKAKKNYSQTDSKAFSAIVRNVA